MRHVTEYFPAKTVEYPRIFPNFENCARCEKDLKDNKDNRLHLGENMLGYLPIFIFTILQSGKFLNLAHYFPYDVKLRLLAHSRSFLANQKARNAIVGAENLLSMKFHVA